MSKDQHQAEDIILPDRLPVFPLRNALLLPGGKLPLNIFEPRYLAMVDHALGHGRLIGMMRPKADDNALQPELYRVGCAGRITSFMETDDGRYLITLSGVSRFVCREEIEEGTPYRQMDVDWSGFTEDIYGALDEPPALRSRLIDVLGQYLQEANMKADWDSIEGAPSQTIVNSVAMSCPFSPDEKQAILEAMSSEARIETLITLMEMALAEGNTDMAEGEDKPSRLQ